MTIKRKTLTSIVAGVTAAALLLGGTFAWTSIQQEAKNETVVDINPGGRLHDDFNGTNKDVYVENFGDTETGVPIFARIRLYEYMEIGQQAGDKSVADADRKAESLITGDTISDTAGWEVYHYGEDSEFTKYWSWKLGNDDETTLPYYMPTFNKNKDSLLADINGTYEGTVVGDIIHYNDYTQYGPDSTKTDTEVYDHDSNTAEEDPNDTTLTVPYSTTDPSAPIDSAHVLLQENVTHEAKQISTTSTVMSMEQWLLLPGDEKIGPYWVFDTDGWAYWAQPIGVGQTTGLLLDSIKQEKVPDDSWYYGINVEGQFATSDDLSAFGENGEELTDNAADLLDVITGNKVDSVSVTAEADADMVKAGTQLQFTATVMKDGTAVEEAYQDVSWEVTGSSVSTAAVMTAEATETPTVTSIDETGLLTVSANETPGTQLTVRAISKVKNTVIGTMKVTVYIVPQSLAALETVDPDSTELADVTVNIDGVDWYVLAKEDGKALLWAADVITDTYMAFDTGDDAGPQWATSDIRTYLNSDYFNSLNELKKYAAAATIYTADSYDRSGEYIETTDKVFLLSEADVYGEVKFIDSTDPREFTLGKAGAIVSDEMKKCSLLHWLRSLQGAPINVAVMLNDGTCDNSYYYSAYGYLRPAMWVTYEWAAPADAVTVTEANSATTVEAGESLEFSASVTLDGTPIDNQGVTWSVDSTAGSTIDGDGVLTVSANEKYNTVLTVTATSDANDQVIGTYTVTVFYGFDDINSVEVGTNDKVTVDGMDWYVLAKEDGKALIWATDIIPDEIMKFGTSNVWSGSIAQTYLNDTFLPTLTTLKDYVAETTIKTAATYNRPTTYTETTDKVFLLTEADVSGNVNGAATTEAQEFTLGEVGVIVTEEMKKSSQTNWLRSPCDTANGVADLLPDGTVYRNSYITNEFYLRPAMWVYTAKPDTVTVTAEGGATLIQVDKTLQFSAEVTKDGLTEDIHQGVTWSVSGSNVDSSISDTGLLTVLSNENNNTVLTITATAKADSTVFAEWKVTVVNNEPVFDAVTVTAAGNVTEIEAGKTLNFTSNVTKNGTTVADAYQSVTWSVNSTAGSTIDNNGKLTVSTNEPNLTELTVTATSTIDNRVVGKAKVTVYNLQVLVDAAEGDKVTLDGTEWWVLKKENGKALIWAADVTRCKKMAYDSGDDASNVWETSDAREYLNGEYFNSLTILKNHVVETTIKTEGVETDDKLFLLNEADVNGTNDWSETTNPQKYTLGVVGRIATDDMLPSNGDNWLRPLGPSIADDWNYYIDSEGKIFKTGIILQCYFRPAMWITLPTE